MTVGEIRAMLPQLSQTVYGKPLVYLDNAATSLRPQGVIDKWVEMSAEHNANLHRAVHYMARYATEEFESARACVAGFIGADSPRRIVFTSGATAAINLVARSLGDMRGDDGKPYLCGGDEIVVSEAEHHSNIVPWQQLCERNGCTIRVLHVDEDGCLDMSELDGMLSGGRVKLLCISHVSNVLGLINPIDVLCRKAHDAGVAVLVDGAQGVVHDRIDVGSTGCDFYVFSGHKLYAAPGTGVLYAAGDWLDRMPPFMGGGEMISSVSFGSVSYGEPPFKFEAGTQNISGVPTLKPAIEFTEALFTKDVVDNYKAVTTKVFEALSSDGRIRLYGAGRPGCRRAGLFSFTVAGVHHADLAELMDKMGIALRSGQMCAEPLMERYGVTGMLRASFAPYNTVEEAEMFLESLSRAMGMLI